MESIIFRNANQNDLKFITKFLYENFLDTYKGVDLHSVNKYFNENYSYDKLSQYLLDKNFKINVIEFDKLIIGVIIVQVFEEIVEIKSIYIDTKYRSMGLGKRLIEDILKDNSTKGVLKVEVYSENLLAIEFYKSLGFSLSRKYLDFDKYEMLIFEKQI